MTSDTDAPVLGQTEFVALRGEILQRAQFQQAVVNLSIVVAGTLLTVFFQFHAPRWVLLTYPLLALFMSLEWSFNNIRIRHIGWYIKSEIEDKWAGPGWETYLSSDAHRNSLSWLSGDLLAYGVFVALPAAVAVIAGLSQTSWAWSDIVFFIVDGLILFIGIPLVVHRSDHDTPVAEAAIEQADRADGQTVESH